MPRNTLIVDASQIKDFLQCPRLWYWRYVKCIQPKLRLNPEGERRPDFFLDQGTLIHAMLDLYYKNLVEMGFNASFNNVQQTLRIQQLKINLSGPEIQFCWDRFREYIAHYQMGGKDFLPLSKDSVEIGFSKVLLDTPDNLFIIEGRIDLINDQNAFVDHKTQGRFYTHYKFDPQFCTYAWAGNFDYGVINYVGTQMKVNKDTFHRLPLQFSKADRLDWEKELIRICHEMSNCLQTMQFSRNRTHCKDGYRDCAYQQLDEQLDTATRLSLIKINYEEKPKWEPWKLDELTAK